MQARIVERIERAERLELGAWRVRYRQGRRVQTIVIARPVYLTRLMGDEAPTLAEVREAVEELARGGRDVRWPG